MFRKHRHMATYRTPVTQRAINSHQTPATPAPTVKEPPADYTLKSESATIVPLGKLLVREHPKAVNLAQELAKITTYYLLAAQQNPAIHLLQVAEHGARLSRITRAGNTVLACRLFYNCGTPYTQDWELAVRNPRLKSMACKSPPPDQTQA